MTLTIEQHAALVAAADKHQAADEYRAGHYDWINGGACAIGCSIRDCQELGILYATIEPSDHAALAAATGVPELAFRLEDQIFEGLPECERRAWPPRFWRAVRPGADYSKLPSRIMARCAEKLAADALNDEIRAVAEQLAALWHRRASGDEPSVGDWAAAWWQAYAVWQQAAAVRQQSDAAWRQAYTVWQPAAAVRQQAAAVRQQSDAAWQQAAAARNQADAAWWQAHAARQQSDAARHDFYRWLADVLCEELSGERS